MVYLLKSGEYLKIGYSDNMDRRLTVYKTYNPDFTVLDIIDGDLNLEKTLHKLCKEFQVPNRKEWFYMNDFIITTWNSLKDQNFINIGPDNLKIKEFNIDYKTKYEYLLNEFSNLKNSYNKIKEKYDNLYSTHDTIRVHLDKVEEVCIECNRLINENKDLKEKLLEIQTKYLKLLEQNI